MNLWKISPKSVHSELRNNFLKIFACRQVGKPSYHKNGLEGIHLRKASADYASVVISKTRDVYFAGSLVEQKMSMVL